MNIFEIIANIINKILNFSLFPSLPSLSLPGSEETRLETNEQEQDDFSSAVSNIVRGERCLISKPEVVNPNARFFSKGSSAWVNQWQGLTIDGVDMHGRHGGTDYTGPQGTRVHNPLAMKVIKVGHYSDSGRLGDYVIGTTTDGLEYYSGHLDNIQVHEGQDLPCGTYIGDMNMYAHTHVQIKRNGTIVDPESVLK